MGWARSWPTARWLKQCVPEFVGPGNDCYYVPTADYAVPAAHAPSPGPVLLAAAPRLPRSPSLSLGIC